ncbi:MAG TPA: sigma-70 family RNA polymerase sigma factor [Polyangiales bacterium]|nr:sigma-70 family RNA polymerase sigma factor [Polyangiales bacterium]
MTSDLELLHAWRTGDNAAGSSLVKRHYRALHRFFFNKAHTHCDDLIQETFLVCIQAKEAFRGESSFRAYLFGLARYQLLTYYRKRKRVRQLDCTWSTVRDLGTTPSGVLARTQQQHRLQLALSRVPIDQQIALELTYWESLPAHEVARVLEIPENTVYSRLRRARARLRATLSMLESSR